MPGEYLPPVVTRLEGDIDDLIRKVEEAKAAIKSLGGTNVKIGFDIDQASLARAKAAATAAFGTGITVPVNFDVNTGGAAARAFAGGAGFGALGWLIGLGRRGVNLFGGVLPGILSTVGGFHLIADSILEVAAVLIPATFALIAFGATAGPIVADIYNHFVAVNTVVTATGKGIPPLTGQFGKLQDAIKPQIYSVLGDALDLIHNKFGAISQVVTGTSDVISYFAARATVALKSSGLSAFMQNAVGDVRGIFNVFGNLAGTVGAVLKNLPGYAQVFLNVLQTVTHAVEVFANSGIGQGIFKFGLAFHGAFLYVGLLGTAVARVIPMILGWVTKLADTAALAAVRAGFTGLADALGGVAGGAEAAAALPWGWIGVVAAAVGVFAYKMATLKDATQQWTQAMQTALLSKGAGTAGFNQLITDQAQTVGKLTQAQVSLANAQNKTNYALTDNAGRAYTGAASKAQIYGNQVNDLTSRQKQLSDESKLYTYRLDALGQKYGGTREASELLTQAGVKMSGMLDKSSQAWKIIQQQVSGVVQGYNAMKQMGGTLGADLFVITQQASDQYKAMQQLNQVWQTFIGTMSQFQGSSVTVLQTVKQMKTDLNAAGTSFTGVNSKSLALQQTFQSTFVPQLQNVIAGMRQAHDSAGQMATVIATSLVNAVNNGALANKGMRQEIYAMAREADPNATNTLSFLKGWVDRNATSFYKMMQIVNKTGAALGNLPKNENLSVHITGKGQWGIVGTGPFAGKPTYVPGPAGAYGAYVRQGTTSHADDVLARVSKGELIVPASMVKGGAVDHLRGRIPGFAAGGTVGTNMAGMPAWIDRNYNTTVNAMAGALGKSMQSAMSQMFNVPGGAGGHAKNLGYLENLWQQAGGPGGYIAHIAAAIAMAESGGNPNARNPSGASGLWQILGQVVPGNIFSPFVNALNAVSKFDSARGFSPWVTYTTGAYRAFMDQGGWLQPGNTLVTNNTGRPERVLAPGEGEGDIVIQIDGREILRVTQKEARRYNRRNGGRGTNKAFSPA